LGPTRLGAYDVGARVDATLWGYVHRAQHSVSGCPATLILRELGDDGDLRERLLEEIQPVARLRHPNIATVHDFGVEQGWMYVAMEPLEGSDLKELIARDVPLHLDERLALMDQVCNGLAFAHAREVVHGGLHPTNIRVLPTGQVKICDFGGDRIASLLARGQGLLGGTPHYRSPEQLQGLGITTRSDVYSLGSLFYELLAGRKAFDAPSVHGVLFLSIFRQATPLETLVPELPAALCAAVEKALAKDPAQRYADAGVMRAALASAGR